MFVPVGGGGLLAGVAGYIKTLMPRVQVVGVEPYEADAMYRSLKMSERVRLDHVGIFADGVAVRQVGRHTFEWARRVVDGIVRVTNDEICAAIKDVFDETRSVMEPAGALSVAGLKTWVAKEGGEGRNLVAILSGANMNFDRLRFVSERAEVGEAREALLGVTIPERPGAFRAFCATIGARVVTEFNYRLASREEAHIFVGLKTSSRRDADDVTRQLRDKGYPTVDLTDNEMAKMHVRHMVGGRAIGAGDERLFRFEFPEPRAPSCSSSRPWGAAGTSASSTTATTARTSVGFCVPSRFRKARWRSFGRSWNNSDTRASRRRRTPHTASSSPDADYSAPVSS